MIKRKIAFVVGARPNFMKVAPLVQLYRTEASLRAAFDCLLVHTGQHYQENMSGSFAKQLGLEPLDYVLCSGSGTHAEQTGRIMLEFEKVCQATKPDWVVVVGDVNSTLACSIVAKKLHIKVCHIEAGLRSFNRDMPEEINRLVTDAISDLFFTTSEEASQQLMREGIDPRKIHFVGNLMIDSLHMQLANLPRADEYLLQKSKSIRLAHQSFCGATLHRPSNVDDPAMLRRLVDVLLQIANRLPIVFPCHPRTRNALQSLGLIQGIEASGRLHLVEPFDYLEMLRLYQSVRFMITDSGGVQEETTALGIPCLTLRHETERPITVSVGTNTLVQDPTALPALVEDIICGRYKRGALPIHWDGLTRHRLWHHLRTAVV